MQLTVAEDGRIFVADWGDSQQVKIHSRKASSNSGSARQVPLPPVPTTRRTSTILSAWLSIPGETLGSRRHRLPKRVSVWNLDDATLERRSTARPNTAAAGARPRRP